tara:strand:+ start:136 stop:465 length:330 start_codon:yes stop_codon:yes gene_type:complete
MVTAQGLIKLGFTPEIDFSLQDEGNGAYIAKWNSASSQPTKAEIEAAHAEWQAEQDSTQYQRDRKAEYPTIDELVVALWEAVIEERMASSIDLQGKRIAIKEKYPKGGA